MDSGAEAVSGAGVHTPGRGQTSGRGQTPGQGQTPGRGQSPLRPIYSSCQIFSLKELPHDLEDAPVVLQHGRDHLEDIKQPDDGILSSQYALSTKFLDSTAPL